MKIAPYLHFNGNCRAAFAFYAHAFGVDEPVPMLYSQGPPEMRAHVPPGTDDWVMHTQLEVAGNLLMGADGPGGQPADAAMSTCVLVDDAATAERVFAALVDGGTISMPIQKTFWSERFGMGSDRFGKAWMVNCAEADCAAPP